MEPFGTSSEVVAIKCCPPPPLFSRCRSPVGLGFWRRDAQADRLPVRAKINDIVVSSTSSSSDLSVWVAPALAPRPHLSSLFLPSVRPSPSTQFSMRILAECMGKDNGPFAQVLVDPGLLARCSGGTRNWTHFEIASTGLTWGNRRYVFRLGESMTDMGVHFHDAT
jgi:hypothetical protein